MRLVLKVGGNQVIKLSTCSSELTSGLFEDKNDHGKHKYKKQTKRKKGEKQFPGKEKGRKRNRVKRIFKSEIRIVWRMRQKKTSNARPL